MQPRTPTHATPSGTTPKNPANVTPSEARGLGRGGSVRRPLRQQGHSQTRAMQPLNPTQCRPEPQPMSPLACVRLPKNPANVTPSEARGPGWRGKRPPPPKAAGTLSDPSDATLEPHPMPPRTPTHVTPSGAPPKNPANVTPSEARGLGWRGSVRRPLSHQ